MYETALYERFFSWWVQCTIVHDIDPFSYHDEKRAYITRVLLLKAELVKRPPRGLKKKLRSKQLYIITLYRTSENPPKEALTEKVPKRNCFLVFTSSNSYLLFISCKVFHLNVSTIASLQPRVSPWRSIINILKKSSHVDKTSAHNIWIRTGQELLKIPSKW